MGGLGLQIANGLSGMNSGEWEEWAAIQDVLTSPILECTGRFG